MVLNQITLSSCECLAFKAKAYIDAYPHGGGETRDPRLEALDDFLQGLENDGIYHLARGVYDLIGSGFHLSLPWEECQVFGFDSWNGESERAFLVHAANPIGVSSYTHLTDIATFPVSPRLQAIIDQMCRLDYRVIPTPTPVP